MASFTVIISNLNQSGRDSSVGITTRYRLDGPGIGSLSIPVARCLERRSVGARLLGLRVRIPPGAWMLVLCVVSTDKAKCRTIKKKEQVRMKNKMSTRENKINRGGGEIFRTGPEPTLVPSQVIAGDKAAGAWR